MRCKGLQELLHLQIDSRLSPEAARQLEEHLKGCPVCAREKETLLNYRRLFSDHFRKGDVPSLSATFTEDFYRRLENEKKVPLSVIFKERAYAFLALPFRRAWVGALAAVVLVSLVGIRIYFGVPLRPAAPLQGAVKENSAILIEIAIGQNKKAAQQKLVEMQTRELLKNIL